MLNEGNQIHNFISSSGSGTVINYGSGSDFLTSYGSGSISQKVTVPTVPVPQRYSKIWILDPGVKKAPNPGSATLLVTNTPDKKQSVIINNCLC
jgi:hypothetical protein